MSTQAERGGGIRRVHIQNKAENKIKNEYVLLHLRL